MYWDFDRQEWMQTKADRAGSRPVIATEAERRAILMSLASAVDRIRDRTSLALVATMARMFAEYEVHAIRERMSAYCLRYSLVEVLEQAALSLPSRVADRALGDAAAIVAEWAPRKGKRRGRAAWIRRVGSTNQQSG